MDATPRRNERLLACMRTSKLKSERLIAVARRDESPSRLYALNATDADEGSDTQDGEKRSGETRVHTRRRVRAVEWQPGIPGRHPRKAGRWNADERGERLARLGRGEEGRETLGVLPIASVMCSADDRTAARLLRRVAGWRLGWLIAVHPAERSYRG